MKSLLKWAAILLGGVFGLAVLLSLVVYFLVDIEDYRGDIQTAVSEATGRTLTIDGELSLRSFPCCGVRIGQVSLSNAPGFADGHFAKAQLTSVSVQLLPLLLSQELLVDELQIDRLDLRLISRRDGQVNWAFDTGEEAAADATDDVADTGSGLALLNIDGVRISDSRIIYRDEATGDDIEVMGLSLETGVIAPGESFSLSGELSVIGLIEAVAASITVDTQARIDIENSLLNLQALQVDAMLDGKDLPGGQIAFAGNVAEVTDIGTAEIQLRGFDGTLKSAGIVARITGDGSYTDAGMVLSGAMNIDPFSPHELLAALGEDAPETTDPKALQKLSLSGDLKIKGDTAKLDNLSLQLDDTQVTGMLRLASIENTAVRFDLKLDQLNVDSYLAPESDKGSATATKDLSADDALPVATLRALDLNGKLNIGSLTVMGLRLTDTNVKLSADDGWIRMKPLTASLYEGSYLGDVRLNVRRNVPRLAVEEKVTGVQIGQLLAILAEGEASLIGKGDMSFVGGANGHNIDELIDGMTGTMVLNLQDGKYLGTDIWHEVRKVWAGVDGSEVPAAAADPYTAIEKLHATAKLKRGMRVDNDLFELLIPFMRVTGNGTVDLNQSTLDYKLVGDVTATPVFDDGADLDKLNGLSLGLGLSGSIDDPSVKVDFGSLAKSVAKSALDKEKDKQVNRLLDKFGLGGASGTTETDGEELRDTQPADEGEQPPKDPKDQLKDTLRGLFDR